MKANNRRKVFGDAVDLLMENIKEKTAAGGLRMLPIKKIRPFHDHPFHLYEGDRLEDMVASVREHGILNPVIVQEIDGGYEMLSRHNRMNAAKLVGLKEIPAIVKTDLSEEEAYVYVIETRDGGRDAIGLYRIGRQCDGVDVEFALEAKRYSSNDGIGVKEVSRLISRLRHRQFGILVTTSFVALQAYQEIKEDGHPIVIISGMDILRILYDSGIKTKDEIQEWLVKTFPKDE